MNWKIVFLAMLLLSAMAVTISTAATGVRVQNLLGRSYRSVADPTMKPMEAIDDASPPG